MKPQINQTQWLELSQETRNKIRAIFGISKSGPTMMIGGTNGKLESDGCTNKDLSVLTVEKMQEYLGNYNITDFYALFAEVLNRLKVEEKVEKPEVVKPTIYDEWELILLRLRAESEANDLTLKLKHLVWEIFPQPIKQNEVIQTTTNKRTAKGK